MYRIDLVAQVFEGQVRWTEKASRNLQALRLDQRLGYSNHSSGGIEKKSSSGIP